MAHRTNVVQVPKEFEANGSTSKVQDPVCGMKMPRRESKHVLFQAGDAVHFCSRTCLDEYLRRQRSPEQKAS